MPEPTQPTCGNPEPHRPHSGGVAPDWWCVGVPDPEGGPLSWLQPGDWVQAWGQVKSVDLSREEVTIEFFSKTDQWQGIILMERVVKPAEPPSFASRCPVLGNSPEAPESTFVRCESHHGHAGLHEADTVIGPMRWTTPAGYFEDP
jgi:hypothetical protein